LLPVGAGQSERVGGSMRTFKAKVAFISAAMMLGSLMGTALVQAEEYRNDYDISVRTYLKVTPSKYNGIYKTVQTSSKEVMVDAARDACLYGSGIKNPRFYGPNSDRPFDCATDFRR